MARLTHRLISWEHQGRGRDLKGPCQPPGCALLVTTSPGSLCACAHGRKHHSQFLLEHSCFHCFMAACYWVGWALEIHASCLDLALNRLCCWRLLNDFSGLWQATWWAQCLGLHWLQEPAMPLSPRVPGDPALRRFFACSQNAMVEGPCLWEVVDRIPLRGSF